MLDIRGSVAVITGGTQGIGRALGEYWVAGGGKVVLADVSEERLEEAKKSLESLGGEAVALTCNVLNEADCSWLAQKTIDIFGKINMVVPCACITRDCLVLDTDKGAGKVIGKMSLESFQAVMNINLTGVFLTVRECVEQMINHDCRGLICLISSTSSLGAAEQLNYSSSAGRFVSGPQGADRRVLQARAGRQDTLRRRRPGICRCLAGKRRHGREIRREGSGPGPDRTSDRPL